MSVFLFLAGIIVLIASIIMSIASWGFIGVIIGLPAGIISSTIFFGLAKVLENQDTILAMLQAQDERLRKSPEKITCTRCKKEYDDSYSGCPHCAYRPGK